MKPLKSKVSITLDEDLIPKIKYLVEQDDRSFSQYIKMALKEHINIKEPFPAKKDRKPMVQGFQPFNYNMHFRTPTFFYRTLKKASSLQ